MRGYDPDEVDAAIAARDARLARLEREAQRLAERVVEREKRLQDALRKSMPAAVTKGIEEIYGQARRQATRIRMKALDDAVQVGLLTIYDMCKAVDKAMSIGGVRVVEKTKA